MGNYALTAHAAAMARERCIDLKWVAYVIAEPAVAYPDPRDGTLTHFLRKIPENGDHALRIVIDSAQLPPRVISLFFDRKATREMR